MFNGLTYWIGVVLVWFVLIVIASKKTGIIYDDNWSEFLAMSILMLILAIMWPFCLVVGIIVAVLSIPLYGLFLILKKVMK